MDALNIGFIFVLNHQQYISKKPEVGREPSTNDYQLNITSINLGLVPNGLLNFNTERYAAHPLPAFRGYRFPSQ